MTSPPVDGSAGDDGPTAGKLPLTRDFFGVEPLPVSTALRGRFFDMAVELGVSSVGINAVRWSDIEPTAPQAGVHNYTWAIFDALALESQRTGIGLQISLHCNSPWGTESTEGAEGAPGSSPVKPEHLDDFRALIRAIVARYNGSPPELGALDGPVIDAFMLGNEIEVPAHWSANGNPPDNPATPKTYYQLLAIVQQEAHAVDPRLTIMRGSTNYGPIFDDGPSEQVLQQRFAAVPAELNAEAFQAPAFVADPPFDAFSVHPNYGALGVYHVGRYLRARLAPDVLLIAEDMRSTLVNSDYAPLHWPDDGPPAGGNGIPDVLDVLAAGATHPDYANARATFQREQSRVVVRKVALAAAAGYDRIYLSSFRDFGTAYPLPEWWFAGLVDERTGARRPAFHAYRLLIDALTGAVAGDYRVVDNDVHTIRFTKGNDKHLVAWRSADPPRQVDLAALAPSFSAARRFPGEPGETDFASVAVHDTIVSLGATPLLLTE